MAQKQDRKHGLIEERQLTKSQVEFLAKETSLAADQIADLRVVDVADKLGDYLDVYWLFKRKLCGRVVQKDPLTGELKGVPGAVVEVQDTDCSGWLRAIGGYTWLYPFGCNRETIATAVTDECGYFCVWIPRWLFEWVSKWRKERICWPIFRPRVVDLIPIPDPLPDPPVVRDPGVIDPPQPLVGLDPRIDNLTARRIEELQADMVAGSGRAALDRVLMQPLSLPPPAPPSDADLVGYTPHPDDPIDFEVPFGPFVQCKDIYYQEWQLVSDVPDITFKVTQKINGSDVEIYSEGYFEVRWDDTGSGDVTLEANPLAVATDDCIDDGIVCQDAAGIISVDDMALDQSASPLYHDDASGYGKRSNRPSTDGVKAPGGIGLVANGEAPYADTVDLLGCVDNVSGAKYYRVLYDKGSGPEPITGTSWSAQSFSLGMITIAPDVDGWIEIKDLVGNFKHLLMKWPTPKYVNTTYDVWLEVADNAKSVLETSAVRRFVLDNSQPQWSIFDVQFSVGGGAMAPLDIENCPIIGRGPTDAVQIRVTWRANAAHLRDAHVSLGGCDSAAGAVTVAGDTKWYWQTSGATDSDLLTATFTIPSGSPAGCYTLLRQAVSRAYNPASPKFEPTNDYWQNDTRRYERRSWAISVVDS